MSVGAFIGAVVGGVIGFYVGGPSGAYYGATIGFSLGMMVDPLTPDMPSVGSPVPDPNISVMSSDIGIPLPDLAGTSKITGHLLLYGGERSEEQYSESQGGGGGKGGGGGDEPDPQITGYKYYMSWVVGIVAGPVDTLYAIYKGEDVVWTGELNFPASGGEETITLDGMGSATFYFGSDDQIANSKVGALLDDATLNSPLRHFCWCFLDDCYIGEYNRAPTLCFMVKKIPKNAFSDKHEIQIYDCNPVHIMWFILQDLTGLPASWLDSTDFADAASALSRENRGMSVLFNNQQSALMYLESINSHIDSILKYGADGKFHPKLIRDDYTVDDLPIINEDVMLEEPTFDRRSWIDTINEVKVQYSELINVIRPDWQFKLFHDSDDTVRDGEGNILYPSGTLVDREKLGYIHIRDEDMNIVGGAFGYYSGEDAYWTFVEAENTWYFDDSADWPDESFIGSYNVTTGHWSITPFRKALLGEKFFVFYNTQEFGIPTVGFLDWIGVQYPYKYKASDKGNTDDLIPIGTYEANIPYWNTDYNEGPSNYLWNPTPIEVEDCYVFDHYPCSEYAGFSLCFSGTPFAFWKDQFSFTNKLKTSIPYWVRYQYARAANAMRPIGYRTLPSSDCDDIFETGTPLHDLVTFVSTDGAFNKTVSDMVVWPEGYNVGHSDWQERPASISEEDSRTMTVTNNKPHDEYSWVTQRDLVYIQWMYRSWAEIIFNYDDYEESEDDYF